jgi:hypothetical protein
MSEVASTYVEIRATEDVGEIYCVDGATIPVEEDDEWLLPAENVAALFDKGAAVPASPEAALLAQAVSQHGPEIGGAFDPDDWE